MPKTLRCGELFAGCPSVIRGETSDEVIINLAQHAHVMHKLMEFTPELLRRARAAVADDKSRSSARASAA